ncbi:hypothetical protein KR222_007139, partial [Zaprionus bogoriensis]
MKCAVHNCANKIKAKEKHSQQLSFFSFPKNPEVLNKWLAFCRKNNKDKQNKINPKSVICNEHFNEEDIQGGLQFQMGLCSKRMLRPGAVPCLNKNNISAAERERRERRKNKKLVAELLEEAAVREEAEANGAIVMAPGYVRSTGIVSVPDFVSANGNAFVPGTPPLNEHDPLAEELEELHGASSKAQERVQSPMVKHKCRTCFRSFAIDDKAKDLCQEKNAVMLYHIEVITGIWIRCRDETLQFMCPACVNKLRIAIDFRETCIQTELKLAGSANAAAIQTVIKEDLNETDGAEDQSTGQSESNVKDEEFSSVFAENEEADHTTVVVESLSSAEANQNAKAMLDPAAADAKSIALGAHIYEDLLNEYRGKGKATRPRIRKVIVIKSKEAKKKKRWPVEPKAKRQKLSKEEKNRLRREKIRAMPLNHVCDQCGASFRVKCNLTIHMLRHTRTKNFQCPECPKLFYDAYMRNIHIRVSHRGELPFICNYCAKAFSSSNTRYLHEKKVHGASPRIHRNLNKMNQRVELREHHTEQAERQPKTSVRHFCSYCEKSYATKYALNLHMNGHIGVKPFKCKLCDASFPDPQSKKRHEMRHDSKRPYECDICLKGFYTRIKLREHERIHTGERPY